jgi:DNA-binding response OmpR family regulator
LAARAFLNSQDLQLSQKEFALLLFFIQNEGKTVSGDEIYENVWRQPMIEDDTALKNALSRLRKKIENDEFQIVAVRGAGYRFEKIE